MERASSAHTCSIHHACAFAPPTTPASIPNLPSEIRNPKSEIQNLLSPIRNPKTPVADAQGSPIQSAIRNLLPLALTLLLPLCVFADDLTPEQCAAQLQKSTVTVRIRLRPDPAKESTADDDGNTASSAQVTVCSGVAVAEKLVVTAAFAASDSQIRLTLPGGEQTDAKLRVLDEFSGLALLEATDAAFKKPLAFSTAPPVAGGWLMAAAGWGAEQPLISVGSVGGVDRAIKGYVYPPLLQCDLRPAETSSGAPIVDRRGELLGVIVAGDHPESQRGWLYAVPVSHVRRLLRARNEKAKEDSVVVLKRRRPTCGLDLEPSDTGILVSKVEAGGPADKAGLKLGDRILTADGHNVRYLYEAKRSTLYKQPGDTMTFVVQRGDEQKKFELVLGGGVELPSASLEKLGELVAPKIDMNLASPTRGKGLPAVTIREPYSSNAQSSTDRDVLSAEKLRLLEKLNAEYRQKIDQQQRELARREAEQKLQEETLEAIKQELETVKKEKR